MNIIFSNISECFNTWKESSTNPKELIEYIMYCMYPAGPEWVWVADKTKLSFRKVLFPNSFCSLSSTSIFINWPIIPRSQETYVILEINNWVDIDIFWFSTLYWFSWKWLYKYINDHFHLFDVSGSSKIKVRAYCRICMPWLIILTFA